MESLVKGSGVFVFTQPCLFGCFGAVMVRDLTACTCWLRRADSGVCVCVKQVRVYVSFLSACVCVCVCEFVCVVS